MPDNNDIITQLAPFALLVFVFFIVPPLKRKFQRSPSAPLTTQPPSPNIPSTNQPLTLFQQYVFAVLIVLSFALGAVSLVLYQRLAVARAQNVSLQQRYDALSSIIKNGRAE